MRRSLLSLAAASLLGLAATSQATVINSTYTSLGGNLWSAGFTVINDGTPTTFQGFTIDIPMATNLTVLGSPATWDSLVAQADPALPDSAFFDSMVKNPADALSFGQSIGGFSVSFAFNGTTPGALPFSVYDSSFQTIGTGVTTFAAAVPEPSTYALMALGLGAVGLVGRRARRRTAMTQPA